jgi:hypothetical protein
MIRSLELHLDELVLEGLPAGCERDLELALERELSRHLPLESLPDTDRASVDGGSLKLGANDDPQAVATRVAEQLCASLFR